MATSINNLNVGDVISFETIAPAILNLKYDQVIFDGVVSWSAAKSFEDIASLHRSLYPSMNQSEVKDDYRSYSYFLFQTTTGPKANVPQALGIPWIKEDTLVISGAANINLLFPNITPDNQTYLFQLLKANGFTNFQVT